MMPETSKPGYEEAFVDVLGLRVHYIHAEAVGRCCSSMDWSAQAQTGGITSTPSLISRQGHRGSGLSANSWAPKGTCSNSATNFPIHEASLILREQDGCDNTKVSHEQCVVNSHSGIIISQNVRMRNAHCNPLSSHFHFSVSITATRTKWTARRRGAPTGLSQPVT